MYSKDGCIVLATYVACMYTKEGKLPSQTYIKEQSLTHFRYYNTLQSLLYRTTHRTL